MGFQLLELVKCPPLSVNEHRLGPGRIWSRCRLFVSQSGAFCDTIHTLELHVSWWRHQMELFSALLVICAGNSPATGEFPAQGPATRKMLMFSLICARVNNREAGDLRRHRDHHDVTVMYWHSGDDVLLSKISNVHMRLVDPSRISNNTSINFFLNTEMGYPCCQNVWW